ncbi:MAG: FHA domain-containing protein [Pseudomonadota bacterium]
MKQINDIPVRRRPATDEPHHPEASPHDPRAAGRAEAPPQRRQIWDIEPEAGYQADPAPAQPAAPAPAARQPVEPEAPAAKPARPRSTPLILRNSTPPPEPQSRMAEAPAPAPEPQAPRAAETQAAPTRGDVPTRKPRVTSARRPVSARTSAEPPAPDQRSAAAPTSGGQPGSRAKTRILGFHAQELEADVFSGPASASARGGLYPAGWIVIVDGPGRGASFAVGAGVSTIGRAEDQAISLDFGDMSVSRSNHASVAYDEEQNKFFIGHGGKSNVVRRNGNPVLSTEELMNGDMVRIGKTTLRFVALCGRDFTWNHGPDLADGIGHA